MRAPHEPTDPEAIKTRRSIVSRLRNLDDRDTWKEFFETYWRLIYNVARKAGLDASEAEEVVQETTVAVAKYIQDFQYNPQVCSFKTWLLHKTRWKILDQVRKRSPECVERLATQTGTERTSAIARIPDPRGMEMDACWEEEWQKNVIEAAMERVKRRIKPDHYQIFYLSAVRQFGPRKVAQMMGTNAAQVYVVRHRVSALVKREVQVLEQLAARPR